MATVGMWARIEDAAAANAELQAICPDPGGDYLATQWATKEDIYTPVIVICGWSGCPQEVIDAIPTFQYIHAAVCDDSFTWLTDQGYWPKWEEA